MTSKEIYAAMCALADKSPLIHCITNPISIAFCANAVLALSCRPIMAEHPLEVREITSSADALLLNLGNITDARVESMKISADCAVGVGIPCVIDLVGVACSEFRRAYARELLASYRFTVIKGNYSEIAAISDGEYKSAGVDAEPTLGVCDIDGICRSLALKYGCCVMASGKTDVVTDSRRTMHISNGTPRLSRITGTGCVLGALTACFLAVCDGVNAAASACSLLGICGEKAEWVIGNGSYAVGILDALSTASEEDIDKYLKLEVKRVEL